MRGVLCFVEADRPLFGGSFTTRGADVMGPKKPYPLVRAGGPEVVGTLGRRALNAGVGPPASLTGFKPGRRRRNDAAPGFPVRTQRSLLPPAPLVEAQRVQLGDGEMVTLASEQGCSTVIRCRSTS